MDGTARSPDALTLGAFALLVLLGGGNFLAVRLSNLELPPFWGAGLRFGSAALLFVGICLALRLRWPRGRQLAFTALFGLLGIAAQPSSDDVHLASSRWTAAVWRNTCGVIRRPVRGSSNLAACRRTILWMPDRVKGPPCDENTGVWGVIGACRESSRDRSRWAFCCHRGQVRPLGAS